MAVRAPCTGWDKRRRSTCSGCDWGAARAYRRLRGRARHEEAAEERIWVRTGCCCKIQAAMLKAAVLLTASAAASAAAAAFLPPISTQASQLGSSFRSSLFSLRQDSFAQPLQQTEYEYLSTSQQCRHRSNRYLYCRFRVQCRCCRRKQTKRKHQYRCQL